MNGAAEAILEELLAQAITQTQLLQRLARGYTGGTGMGAGANPATNAASSLSSVVSQTNLLGAGFKMLGGVAKIVWGAFNSLIGIVSNVANTFASLGKTALETGIKLSDYYNMFSSVPILGGLFQLRAALQQVNESMLELYRNVSTVGATFGGSLDRARSLATEAGLSFNEFAKVVRQNANELRMFGGTVEAGATRLSRMNMEFMKGTDKSGRSILGLGVKFDEAGDYLASYMGSLASTGDQRNKSDQQIISGAREYVMNLDMLARLTGEEKEALDKKLRQQREDEAFNAYVAGIVDETERRKIIAMRDYIAVVEPTALRQFQAGIRGLSMPMEEYGQMLVMTGQSQELASSNYMDIIKKSKDTNDVIRMTGQMFNRQGENFNKFAGGSTSQLAFLTEMFKGAGQGAMKLNRQLGSGEGYLSNYNQALREQTDTSKGNAAAAATTELNARTLGQGLLGIADQISKAFGPALTVVEKWLMGPGITALKAVGDALGRFTSWLLKTIDEYINIFKEGGLKALMVKIFDDIGNGMSSLWKSTKDFYNGYLTPWFDELMVKFKYWFMDVAEAILPDWMVDGDKESRARDMARELELVRTGATLTKSITALEAQAAQGRGGRSLTPEQQAELIRLYREQQANERAKNTPTPLPPPPQVPVSGTGSGRNRHSGTIGMTGNWWEKESGPINVQAGETVLTQGQLAQIVDTAGSNKLAVQVERLNNLTAQMLVYLKETADNTARTHKAAAAMSGNAFVM